ncbi:MAG: fibronectin type III domain-containing protein, partial [Bacteroidales bacterium]|nr:fibronectin type III domain-containing protein [Bacteroidales bacterium]
NNQTASLKIMLTQSTQPSILEVLTDKPEPVLKSIDDVITFDEGDTFEFTGYYYSQTSKKTAVITGDKTITFSFTKVSEPTVTTVAATDIQVTEATVGGNVTKENGASVTERGVCWATTNNPTVSNNKKSSGTGTGTFSVTLSSLSDGTTYYVRAYAINSYGIAYGNTVTFTTVKKVAIVNGAIQKAFSVSASKKVYFSQGNLQYNARSNTWRFAGKQYDMIGANNNKISSTYNGWIDLFGYGTSAYGVGDHKYLPYNTSTDYDDYPSQDIAGTVFDWGVGKPISNGGNQKGLWRTLTKAEWYYLLATRADALSKVGRATVNNVKGLVVLPDEWTTPKGITFKSLQSLIGSMHDENKDFSINTYTESDWLKMEMNGAVFFPCGGYRNGSTVKDSGSVGRYWSASAEDSYDSYCLTISSETLMTSGEHHYYGHSVRLVQDVK